jgi:hypothetical protein
MIRNLISAALLAVSLAAPASAADQSTAPQGHWEWKSVPQYGPRATGPTQRRVWVPDSAQMANCDCDMMKMSADECMGTMHRGRDKLSAG